MSSASSHGASNWSLGTLVKTQHRAAICFPNGWNSNDGPTFDWYKQLPCTKFASLQYRKTPDAPFYHEFICVKLIDDNFCVFERFGDPYARIDALTTSGSAAHDFAEIFSSDRLTDLDKNSDVLLEVTFPHELDLIDILEICYVIQQDARTRTYTLQRYNCYFFCWCVLSILARGSTSWDNTPSHTPWRQTSLGLVYDLRQTPASLRVPHLRHKVRHILLARFPVIISGSERVGKDMGGG